MDNVEAMNISFKKNTTTAKNSITGEISRSAQKNEICLAFFSTDLEHIFGRNVEKDFGVMLKRKGPHTPEIAYDIVTIHCLMICKDLTECNIVSDMKVPFLRCFLFFSKLKDGDVITTGQSKNYQTLSNPQFRPLLKKIFSKY